MTHRIPFSSSAIVSPVVVSSTTRRGEGNGVQIATCNRAGPAGHVVMGDLVVIVQRAWRPALLARWRAGRPALLARWRAWRPAVLATGCGPGDPHYLQRGAGRETRITFAAPDPEGFRAGMFLGITCSLRDGQSMAAVAAWTAAGRQESDQTAGIQRMRRPTGDPYGADQGLRSGVRRLMADWSEIIRPRFGVRIAGMLGGLVPGVCRKPGRSPG